MKKETLIKILKDFCDGDLEQAHINADEALLEFINDKDVTEAFKCNSRWYA